MYVVSHFETYMKMPLSVSLMLALLSDFSKPAIGVYSDSIAHLINVSSMYIVYIFDKS